MYGFLLVFFSNFVPENAPFWDIRLQTCRDLENRVRGPSRLLEISPFDRAHTTSYWRSIVTIPLYPGSGVDLSKNLRGSGSLRWSHQTKSRPKFVFVRRKWAIWSFSAFFVFDRKWNFIFVGIFVYGLKWKMHLRSASTSNCLRLHPTSMIFKHSTIPVLDSL